MCMCLCLAPVGVGVEGGGECWMGGCVWIGGVGGVGGEWVEGLDQGLEEWGGGMSVMVVSSDSLCRWQFLVSVYCSWRIPEHLGCTQCSSCCTVWISAS